MLAFHDEGVIIFFLITSAIYPILYSLIYNTEIVHDVTVLVVDDDRSHLTRSFARMLDATPEVCVVDYAANMEEAKTRLASKECYGIIHLPADFTRNVLGGEKGTVMVYGDMGVMLHYKQIVMGVTAVQQVLSARIQSEKMAIIPTTGGAVIESKEVPMGNTAKGLASTVLPCILILVLQQSMILGICVLRGGSRERRLQNRGFDPMNVDAGVACSIIGKTLCHVFIYIVPAIYVLHFVPIFFAFPQNGHVLDVLVMVVPFLIASSLMGQTLQVFVNDRESSFLSIVFTSVIFVFLTGISWPRYLMPSYWVALGDIIPSTWAANAYILMHTNGAKLHQVTENYHMLWALCGFYFVVAYLIERFIARPRYRRMQHYASINHIALIEEEYRRNAVDIIQHDDEKATSDETIQTQIE